MTRALVIDGDPGFAAAVRGAIEARGASAAVAAALDDGMAHATRFAPAVVVLGPSLPPPTLPRACAALRGELPLVRLVVVTPQLSSELAARLQELEVVMLVGADDAAAAVGEQVAQVAPPADFATALRALRDRYLATVPAKLAALRDGIAAGDAPAVAALAHRIAGTAGSFGFARAGEVARSIEHRAAAPDPAWADDLDAVIAELAAALAP